MWLIDANVILRYLLGDNEEMQSEAEKVIDEGAFTLPEVLAEVVYVLTKVYGSGRAEVCNALRDLLDDVEIENKGCILEAFYLFEETSLDFVDCILIGRNKVKGEKVFSFDKKLNNRLD
ncbi:MAG: PIN domain-containing protein [Lachnospiraceae bacterium]|nr:PIN domain-containing protein [Lachnospiraceae bacterium]